MTMCQIACFTFMLFPWLSHIYECQISGRALSLHLLLLSYAPCLALLSPQAAGACEDARTTSIDLSSSATETARVGFDQWPLAGTSERYSPALSAVQVMQESAKNDGCRYLRIAWFVMKRNRDSEPWLRSMAASRRGSVILTHSLCSAGYWR